MFVAFMCLVTGVAFAQSSIPDLKGKWKSKSYGHHHVKRGFYTTEQGNGIWIVKEQQGRYFFGERTYIRKSVNNTKLTEGFSGVISRDGKRIYLVDHEDDFFIGDILSNDSIELVHQRTGNRF